MTELLDLYQEVILDHNRAPHNYRRLANASKTALGHNPLCGDQLTLYLNVEDGVIADVSFLGSGCAISKASASIMTDEMKGKTVEDAEALFDRFHAMLTGAPDARPDTKGLGKLAVFAGVREFPVRVKCATLAWHTLKSALQGESSASTE